MLSTVGTTVIFMSETIVNQCQLSKIIVELHNAN